jgi:hypothetical protein
MFVLLFSALCDNIQVNTAPGEFLVHEQFTQEYLFNRWQPSRDPYYTGRWMRSSAKGKTYIKMKTQAVPHAATAAFDTPLSFRDKTFILQFYIKSDANVSCSAGYIKFFGVDFDPTAFRRDSPYLLSFGPDTCGLHRDLIAFTFTGRNVQTNDFEEKRLIVPPRADIGPWGTLYQLVVFPDNRFEIRLQGKLVLFGSLLTHFAPAVRPLKEIDDPTDVKPIEWDNDEFIVDPAYKKSSTIDDSEDPPTIRNRKFKGHWQPRQIPNPHYNEQLHPHNFPDFGGIGFDSEMSDHFVAFADLIISDNLTLVRKYNEIHYPDDELLQRHIQRVPEAETYFRLHEARSNPWGIFTAGFEDHYPFLLSLLLIVVTTLAIVYSVRKNSFFEDA